MRILIVHNKYVHRGGEDTAVAAEYSLLLQKRHEVEVLYFDNAETASINKLRLGVEAIYNRGSAQKIHHAIESFKPDVIHVHNLFYRASPSVFFAAKKHGIPVVMTLHNYRLVCANGLLLRDHKPCEDCVPKTLPLDGIRHRCFQDSAVYSGMVTATTSTHRLLRTWNTKVNHYIALTEFARNIYLTSSLKLKAKSVSVLPNYVTDNGVGEVEGRQGYLFVGRMVAEKGVIPLLEAFSLLPQQKLMLAGDGPLLASLQESYKTCPNIIFKGALNANEVQTLLKSSKALLVPSLWYEGLPYTVLEAFSTGTPVLASDIGSLKEMVQSGENGYLYPPNDAAGIKSAIETFERTNTQPIYRNARRTYEINYSPEAHYTGLLQTFERAQGHARH